MTQMTMSKTDRFPQLRSQSELDGPDDRSWPMVNICDMLLGLRDMLSVSPKTDQDKKVSDLRVGEELSA